MDYQQLPIALGLSLAMNEKAMNRFSSMTEAEKEQMIASSKNIASKSEMDSIVNSLAVDEELRIRNMLDGPGIL